MKKIMMMVMLFLVLPIIVVADSINIESIQTFGGTSSEFFNSVIEVKDGYIAVGHSHSINGDMAGLNKGRQDAIIVKYDKDLNLVWKKTFGGTENDVFKSIIEVSDGYIIAGWSGSNNYDLEGMGKGFNDAIIVKYDKDGNFLWANSFGGNWDDLFYDIVEVDDGYVTVGNSYSITGDLEGLNLGTYDGIIVKYDKTGKMVWKKAFGGTEADSLESVIKLDDGYLVAGHSMSNDYDLEGINIGSQDAVIAKYDKNWKLLWVKTFGGSEYEYFKKVTKVSDGFIAVGQSTSNDGNLNGLNKGSEDAIIVKYDKKGNIVWQNSFGGTWGDYFDSVIEVGGGYVAVGVAFSKDLDMENLNKGFGDGIIVKYDKSGNLLLKDSFGGTSGEEFYDVIATSSAVIVVGHVSSVNGDMEGLNLNKGSADAIIIKYNHSYTEMPIENPETNEKLLLYVLMMAISILGVGYYLLYNKRINKS